MQRCGDGGRVLPLLLQEPPHPWLRSEHGVKVISSPGHLLGYPGFSGGGKGLPSGSIEVSPCCPRGSGVGLCQPGRGDDPVCIPHLRGRAGGSGAAPPQESRRFTDGYRCHRNMRRDLGISWSRPPSAHGLSHICPAPQGPLIGPSTARLARVFLLGRPGCLLSQVGEALGGDAGYKIALFGVRLDQPFSLRLGKSSLRGGECYADRLASARASRSWPGFGQQPTQSLGMLCLTLLWSSVSVPWFQMPPMLPATSRPVLCITRLWCKAATPSMPFQMPAGEPPKLSLTVTRYSVSVLAGPMVPLTPLAMPPPLLPLMVLARMVRVPLLLLTPPVLSPPLPEIVL